MQRYIRGLMLAGTAVVAWGCADNPISDGAGDAAQIVASPSSMFVDAGETVTTTVEVQNDQGAALESEFTILNVDAGITAVIDSTFNPYYDKDGNLVPPTSPRRIRVLVTGGSEPGVFGFDVAASGLTAELTTRVLPLDVTGTLSTTAPACNESVTYTVAAPYKFSSSSAVSVANGIQPLNQSVAADGLSITFTPGPGYDGALTISDVELDFLPGAPVELLTNEALTVGTDCGFTGVDDPGTTAPAIPAPAIGTVASYFDAGNIAIDQWYEFTVTSAGNYAFTWDWSNGADVDFFFVDDTISVVCSAATGAQPESCSADLVPGTYYIVFELYAGAAPEFFWTTIDATGGN